MTKKVQKISEKLAELRNEALSPVENTIVEILAELAEEHKKKSGAKRTIRRNACEVCGIVDGKADEQRRDTRDTGQRTGNVPRLRRSHPYT